MTTFFTNDGRISDRDRFRREILTSGPAALFTAGASTLQRQSHPAAGSGGDDNALVSAILGLTNLGTIGEFCLEAVVKAVRVVIRGPLDVRRPRVDRLAWSAQAAFVDQEERNNIVSAQAPDWNLR